MKKIITILAGGTGKRMGNVKLPKQFLEICGIPVIVLTIRNILASELFDQMVVVFHPEWREYLAELLKNYNIDTSRIAFVRGGQERIESIENALDFLKGSGTSDDDIVVIHDAVRPFASKALFTNAIAETQKYGATVAIVPAKDTMIFSENGIATDMPDRTRLFHGQAPDSFTFKTIYDALKSLTPEEKAVITGTAQICQKKGIVIHTFLGEENNIKITTIEDMFLAKAIYEELYK
ncbi:MAG: 2-C-methyl-D-erythritol 4-phosphate cytidylyltransferase [Spirochaetia bacterium]|nr:2-C-methyl-D-erythritol 4-phosphate cytidylyltransferase [Spirochaetia bacterium]MBR5017709.1 2-C-methyl-D-erythritol 4-phosphate cytidylyltransferase [Spirochaetia bacterium]